MDPEHREAQSCNTLTAFVLFQEHAGGPVANWQCGKLTFYLVASRDESRGYSWAILRRAQCHLAMWQSERSNSGKKMLRVVPATSLSRPAGSGYDTPRSRVSARLQFSMPTQAIIART
jgi:hypothetical protein